ncbi:putative uncharacterized protein [Firmicutes bacterium CAG:227]|nr:putative uncharacterized protein [Firmicutes bacterium CAG:227]
MKKIFKKNQVIITALAIMIAVAGYINYSDTHLGMDKVLQKTGALSDTSDTEVLFRILPIRRRRKPQEQMEL